MFQHLLKQFIGSQTAKDSFISSTGQLAASVMGAVFFALTARFLGPKNFGIFSLALASAVIVKDLLGPAINANLLRFVPAQTDKTVAYQYIKYAALIVLAYYAVISPIILVANRFFSFVIFHQFFFALIPLTIATALGFSLAGFISGYLQAEKMFFQDALLTMAQPMLRLIFLTLVYSLGLLSIQSLLVLNLTAYVIVSVAGLSFFSPAILATKVSAKVRRATNRFLPLMAASVGTSTVTDRLNLFITNFYTSASEVSLLAVVGALFTPAKQISGSISSVLGSRFAAFQTRAEAYDYLQKAVALSSLMASLLITSMIFARPVILIIYGQAFADAIPIFQVFTIAYAFFIFQIPFSAMLLYFKGRSDLLAVIAGTSLILTVAANLILIPRFGVIGAASSLVAVLIASAIITIAASFLARRHVRST